MPSSLPTLRKRLGLYVQQGIRVVCGGRVRGANREVSCPDHLKAQSRKVPPLGADIGVLPSDEDGRAQNHVDVRRVDGEGARFYVCPSQLQEARDQLLVVVPISVRLVDRQRGSVHASFSGRYGWSRGGAQYLSQVASDVRAPWGPS